MASPSRSGVTHQHFSQSAPASPPRTTYGGHPMRLGTLGGQPPAGNSTVNNDYGRGGEVSPSSLSSHKPSAGHSQQLGGSSSNPNQLGNNNPSGSYYTALGHRTNTFNPQQQQYSGGGNNGGSSTTSDPFAGAMGAPPAGSSGMLGTTCSQSAPMSPAHNNQSASRSRNYPPGSSGQPSSPRQLHNNHRLSDASGHMPQPQHQYGRERTGSNGVGGVASGSYGVKSPTSSTASPQQQYNNSLGNNNNNHYTHSRHGSGTTAPPMRGFGASTPAVQPPEPSININSTAGDALDITPSVSIIVLPPPTRVSLDIDTPPVTSRATMNTRGEGGNANRDVGVIEDGTTVATNSHNLRPEPSQYSTAASTSNHPNGAAAGRTTSASAAGGGGRSCSESVASSQAVKCPAKPYAGLFGHIGASRSDREMKKSGWLEKYSVGRSFFPVRNWQKRWFQITADGLNYAKVPNGEMAVRTFVPFVQSRKPELRLCPVFLLPNVTAQVHPEATDPKVYYFGLRFEEKGKSHTLLLRSSAAEERDQWVRFLAQFIHAGSIHGVPSQHPVDPSVPRLHDPEQLDLPERIALRRVVVDWDEGYQEYRHKFVDRVNRAISAGGGVLGGGGGNGNGNPSGSATRAGSARSNASRYSANDPAANSNNGGVRNSSVGSNPMQINAGAASRTTSGKSGRHVQPNTPPGYDGSHRDGGGDIGGGGTSTAPYFSNNNNTPNHGYLNGARGVGRGMGGGGGPAGDVFIMDDSHVLASSGMDPSMVRESYFDPTLAVEGGDLERIGGGGGGDSGSPTSRPNNMSMVGSPSNPSLSMSAFGGNGKSAIMASSPGQRSSRGFALTLPSAPPTPTNDDL